MRGVLKSYESEDAYLRNRAYEIARSTTGGPLRSDMIAAIAAEQERIKSEVNDRILAMRELGASSFEEDAIQRIAEHNIRYKARLELDEEINRLGETS